MSDDTTFAGRRPGLHAARGPMSFLDEVTAPAWMRFGIWGGLSERERRKLIRSRKEQA